MARRKEAHGGGHGWFVTFADLMGLLVSFFVMLVAFSNHGRYAMSVAGKLSHRDVSIPLLGGRCYGRRETSSSLGRARER